MIKEILKLIALGGITLAEMAQRLKIGVEELKMRLEMMERMGYVESPKEADGECAFCHTKCSACDYRPEGATYRITEKGFRCLSVA